MWNQEEGTVNLSEVLTGDEETSVRGQIAGDMARHRHDDFDETINSHKFTEDEVSRIYAEDIDLAETAYEIAKAANFVTADEFSSAYEEAIR